MKQNSIIYLVAISLLLLHVGCTAEVPGEESIGVSKQSMTLDECEAQRDQCLDEAGLFGLVTCNIDFTLCAMTSETGLPTRIRDAIAAAAACREELDNCVRSAETPSELSACAESQAQCVADVLDIQLPEIVTGTAACVDSGIECINNAESLSDLDACGETMAACALEEATSLVPEQVGAAVTDIAECTFALDDCIRAASTPAELRACGEAEAACVADSLGIELPDTPLSDIVGCAETAIDCTLQARSIESLSECANGFNECRAAVVDSLDAPQVLDCQLAWVSCLLRNPFAFIPCAQELRGCLE
ncbi:MAG: hypothetical protein JXA30_19345 [Deltaproteobacteria bacterium]|nr:hypothetical protein [Deltaproteobacteria bacterium]